MIHPRRDGDTVSQETALDLARATRASIQADMQSAIDVHGTHSICYLDPAKRHGKLPEGLVGWDGYGESWEGR